MHGLVLGVLRQPLLGGELGLGQVATARVRELGADLRRLLGETAQQHAPAALGDVDDLAVDQEDGRGIGLAQVELDIEQGEGFFEGRPLLDRDGADVDGEAVDLLARGAAAHAAQALGHQHFLAGGHKARGHAEASGAGADHDGVVADGVNHGLAHDDFSPVDGFVG
ncbi:hypothetical protein D3C71_1340820 [compost metagenome]